MSQDPAAPSVPVPSTKSVPKKPAAKKAGATKGKGSSATSVLENNYNSCGKQSQRFRLVFQGLGNWSLHFSKDLRFVAEVLWLSVFEVCFQTYHVLVHVGHAWREEGILVWEQEK